MAEAILELTPDMSENEIMANVAQFIWERSNFVTRNEYTRQAKAKGLERGEELLLRNVVRDRRGFNSTESWLSSLPGLLRE